MESSNLRKLLDAITNKLGGALDRSFESDIDEIKQWLVDSGEHNEHSSREEDSEARIRRLMLLGTQQYQELAKSMLPHYLPLDFDLFQRLYGGADWSVRESGSLALNGFGFHIGDYHDGLQDPHETGVVDLHKFPFLPIGSVGFPARKVNNWVYRDIVMALGGSPLAGRVFAVASSGVTPAAEIEAAKGLSPQAVLIASSFDDFLEVVLGTSGDLGLDPE